VWRFNHKIRSIPAGKILRIETLKPVVVHWSPDDWHTAHDVAAHEVGLGIYIADLATERVPEGKPVKFTFYWPDGDHWQGADFVVHVGSFKRANGDDARQD
jgi:glucoamylase